MPQSHEWQILPADHPLQKIITIMNTEFPVSGSDEKVKSEIAFGITGYDRKGANALFDFRRDKTEVAEIVPEVVYDAAFDWTKPATQQYLVSVCDMLDNSGIVKADRAPDCDQEPCEQRMTACVVRELGHWLNRTLDDCEGDNNCRSAAATVAPDDPLGRSGTYADNYNLPGGFFPDDCFSTGALCIPEDLANVILWDFYMVYWKDYMDRGVGFRDSAVPSSKVKYIILQFSLDMKRRAHYSNSDAMVIYTKVDDF
eukprot:SAG11_NODE_10191_length_848_cov_1.439252_1_plen_255_part_01